jgi:hypothetical protein
MNNYQYTLDTSSKKFNCPKCNTKRFVRYIFTDTKEYAPEQFGRCDRQETCGYFLHPGKGEVDKHEYLYHRFNSINKTENTDVEPSYLPDNLVEASVQHNHLSTLFAWLCSVFKKDEVKRVFDLYKVGLSKKWPGSSVFFQVDLTGKVRAGKIMAYGENGKRLREEGKGYVTWVHSVMKLPDYNLNQCLFGEHLLGMTGVGISQKIGLVESEKTALIMAIAQPDRLWMATGGMHSIADKLEILRGLDVIAYPDVGCYEDWRQRMKLYGFQFYRGYERFVGEKKGWDIADFVLDAFSKQPSHIAPQQAPQPGPQPGPIHPETVPDNTPEPAPANINWAEYLHGLKVEDDILIGQDYPALWDIHLQEMPEKVRTFIRMAAKNPVMLELRKKFELV